MQHWGAFVQPLLLWKSKKHYVFWVCVCRLTFAACKSACSILSSVASPAVQNFSRLSHKRHDIRKTIFEHKMCVLIFSTTSVRKISHPKNNSARYYYKCTPMTTKYPLLSSDFNGTYLIDNFRKILTYKLSWKPVQWQPSCSIRTEGHDEAISRLSQFGERT